MIILNMKNRNKSELNSMKKFILMIVALSLLSLPMHREGAGNRSNRK